jgi:mRNA interferase MazF
MNRGDVVEVDWWFSDLTGSKRRPAVVVQADYLNGVIDDTVLVQITSTGHGLPDTEVLLDPAVETGSGLSRVCFACCMNILTYDQSLIIRTIGFLSPAAMQEVDRCLKAVLELP